MIRTMLRINRIGTEAAVDIEEASPEASSVRRQRRQVFSSGLRLIDAGNTPGGQKAGDERGHSHHFLSSGFGSFGPAIFCARPAACFSYCALSTVNFPNM